MNVFKEFRLNINLVIERLSAAGRLPVGLDCGAVTAEPPRDPEHGDIATNAALVLAKQAGMKPRDIAAALAPELAALCDVVSADIAGPGFINIRLSADRWRAQLHQILADGDAYGNCDVGGGEKINVEYVSANPTGPLHIGHVRGAVYGDALAALLDKAGFAVTKEYYINDAGAQVEPRVSLDLEQSGDREVVKSDGWRIAPGLVPGEPNQGRLMLVAERPAASSPRRERSAGRKSPVDRPRR